MYHGSEPFIFISYAHLDSDRVYPIINGLEEHGFRVWYDNGIEAGTEWPEYIAEKIIASNVVVALLSENSLNSFNCKREINFAIDEKKELLVIHLEELKLSPGMKMQLNSLQAMFRYKYSDEQQFMNALCKARILDKCREEKETSGKAIVIEEKPVPTQEPKKIIVEEAPVEQEPENNIIVKDFSADEDTEKKIIIEEAPVEEITEKKTIIEEKTISEKTVSENNQNTDILIQRKLTPQLLKDAALYANKHKNDDMAFIFSVREQTADRRIYNAIKRYAEDADINDVCAILDTTIFESGKTGFLVTKTQLYGDILNGNIINLTKIKSVRMSKKSYLLITYTDNTEKEHFFNIYYFIIYQFLTYIIEHS